MKIKLVIYSLLLVFFASCSSSRKTASVEKKVKKISAKSLQNKIEKRESEFDWFSAKVKMNYADSKFAQAFTANIRMKRDSIVWMSLTGFLGIEGGRVIMTKDSVKIIDRLNKKYYEYPLSYAQKYVPFQADISSIQDIIAGSRLLDGKEINDVGIDKYQYQGSTIDKLVKVDFWVHPENYTYSEMRLKHRFENQEVIYKFDNYKNVNKHLFSHTREIEISQNDEQIFIDMVFAKIDMEKAQMFPFEIPVKYDKVR